MKKVKNTVFKSILFLAIPTMIEEILNTLLLYVDTAMVGHLGEKATAAVSTTTTIFWLCSCIPHALSAAFLALIARACGAGDKNGTRSFSGQAMLLSVILGLLVSIMCVVLSPFVPLWMHAREDVANLASKYFLIVGSVFVFRTINAVFGSALRAVKNTKTPMVINVMENVLNIVLNAFFIYGLGLGVCGAAVGSAISYTASGIAMVVAARRYELLKFEIKDMVPDFSILKKCFDIGFPAFLTSSASCLGYVFFAGMVSSMGTVTFAAHSIAVNAEQLFYIPGYGFRAATSSLVGNAIGENDYEKKLSIEKVSIIFTVFMMVITGGILYLVSFPLMSFFTPVYKVAELGAKMLRLVSLTEPFFGLMIVVEGIFYGSGKTKEVFYVETFSMWAIRIVFTYICINILYTGLTQVWYCMIADNIFKALCLFVIYYIGRKKTIK